MAEGKYRRHLGIDALRGLAIVAMVAAHLARETLARPVPLWLCVFFSVAAPLFVMLAGLMVAQTYARKQYPISRYLSRSATLLAVAAALDLFVWRLIPFVGFDVLYLIAAALPLAALFCRLRPAWQLETLVAFPVCSELMRHGLGYPQNVLALTLARSPVDVVHNAPTMLHQWLVSGWFPLFPWLFFALLGVRIFQAWKWDAERFLRLVPGVGAGLVGAGLLYGWLVPTPLHLRGGYCELFYPASAAFVGIAAGLILILFRFIEAPWLRTNRLLIRLGQHSLLLYVLHLMVIHWGLGPVFDNEGLLTYAVLYAGVLVGLLGVTMIVEQWKRRSEVRAPVVPPARCELSAARDRERPDQIPA